MRKPSIRTFGTERLGVEIFGNNSNPEPEMFTIKFPGGEVTVTRATDTDRPDYWVHVNCNRPDNSYGMIEGDEKGRIVDARLDQTDKHASESNLGDFGRDELYHLAVRVSRKGEE